MGDVWRSFDGSIELYHGDYLDVLAGISCDHCITDPPYSSRTHSSDPAGGTDGSDRAAVAASYAAWTESDVIRLFDFLSGSCHGWIAALTDHVLAPAFEICSKGLDRYPFAPVPVIEPGRNVRMQGDGPACWGLWLMASRPRRPPYSKWGALPGGYVAPTRGKLVSGGKSIELMRALVCDYSRPGETILDPCAGAGTTLLAAKIEGRRAIGAEVDRDTWALAVERLERRHTPSMLSLMDPQ